MPTLKQTPEPVHIEDPEASSYRVMLAGGMSKDALPDPPKRGESKTYIVKATCSEARIKKVNGSDRLVCVMDMEMVYEQGKVPIVDDAQPMLFDDAMAAEAAERDDDQGDNDTEADGVGEFSEPTRAFDPEQRLDGHGPKLFSAVE